MSSFELKMVIEDNAAYAPGQSDLFNRHTARAARAFHSKLPGYRPTPLLSLPALALRLALNKFWLRTSRNALG